VVPALSLAIDGYVLYTAFFQNLLAKPFKSGGSIVWLSLAWAIIGMIWAACAWARRPAANDQARRLIPADGNATPGSYGPRKDWLLDKSAPRRAPRPC
jgi:hypothetical protein